MKKIFKITLIGDSISQGSGADSTSGMKMPYSYILKSLYSFLLFKYFKCKLFLSKLFFGKVKYQCLKKYKYENYDIFRSEQNSAFLTNKKWGIQYKIKNHIKQEIQMKHVTKTGLTYSTLNNREDSILKNETDLLIVVLGANDFFLNISVEEFTKNIEKFFKKLVFHNHYKIVLITGLVDFLPMFNSDPETIMTYTPFCNKAITRKNVLLNVSGGIADDLNILYPAPQENIETFMTKNKLFNEIIKKYSLLLGQSNAFKGKVLFLDINNEFKRIKNIDDFLAMDGLHLNKKGQKWIADTFFSALEGFI